MKRSRHGLPLRSQPKKPQIRKLSFDMTKNNALAFLKVVDETFRYEKENRQMFIDAMNALNEKRIGKSLFIARVLEIIKGHDHLVGEFNAIIPLWHRMYLQGFVFYDKVEERLGSTDEFQTFKDMLYFLGGDNTITKEEFMSAMNCIIGKHADLMEDFKELLDSGHMQGFTAWLFS